MKNKFFLLGLLALMFAVAVPAMADPHPGGVAVQTAVLSDAVIVSDQLAVKEVIQTVAGFAVAVLLTLLMAVAFSPFMTRRTADDGPTLKYEPPIVALTKRAKSPLLKRQAS